MTRPWPDWFTDTYARPLFEKHLGPYAGREQFHALQIGAYCGDASEWLVKNVLTGFGSLLIDVDTWEGSDEAAHKVLDWEEIRRFYQERMSPYNNRHAFMVTSDTFFKVARQHTFHFIYIDGAHNSEQVLRDAVNADRVLELGGIIAFDDYLWSDGTQDIPHHAINAFLTCYSKRYEVLEKDYQVWVRRIQ